MPGTDGKDVYEALRRAHPELLDRMVFASGGPTSGRAQDFLRQPGIVLLDKPLTTEALTQFIARRFSGSASRAGRDSAKTGSMEGTEWK